MELNRRVAHGRLSEIFGESILGYDRFMREIVADLDNAWRLTSADIDAALK